MTDKNKYLVIIRHAHRPTGLLRMEDNGLSNKGIKQAQNIMKYFKLRGWLKLKSIILASSSRKRCLETLMPISKKLGCTIQILAPLNESITPIRQAKAFLKWYFSSDIPFLTICVHGDWAAHFFKLAFGFDFELKKGGIVILNNTNKKIQIEEIHQDLSLFI